MTGRGDHNFGDLQHVMENETGNTSVADSSKKKISYGGAKLATTLQPKLIQPPSKLSKTLEHQAARASHVKRKQ